MNTIELNALQDLFISAPKEIQDAIFVILNYVNAKNKLPQDENVFDLQSEVNPGIMQIKKSGLIKENTLDSFEEPKEEPKVIAKISEEEQEDLKQFTLDLQEEPKKQEPKVQVKKSVEKGNSERNLLTDTMVIKNLKSTGNGPDDNKNAKKDIDSPYIESLWSQYSKLYGEQKALEMGRSILEIANADYNYGIKELKGVKAREYWKNIADLAEKKFGVKPAWGIAYKAQIILLTADKLGYPVKKIGD